MFSINIWSDPWVIRMGEFMPKPKLGVETGNIRLVVDLKDPDELWWNVTMV